MKRPVDLEIDDEGGNVSNSDHEDRYGVDEFRRDIINAVQNPPHTHWDDAAEEERNYTQSSNAKERRGGYFIVTSFARHALQQTGAGHFSPIAAYHPPSDSCLVLDVARFKYAPYWVSVNELYDAMKPLDNVTNKSRGWILMYPPLNDTISRYGKRERNNMPMSKEEHEGKRPAACVQLAGSGKSVCPMEKIKIDYCSVGK